MNVTKKEAMDALHQIESFSDSDIKARGCVNTLHKYISQLNAADAIVIIRAKLNDGYSIEEALNSAQMYTDIQGGTK